MIDWESGGDSSVVCLWESEGNDSCLIDKVKALERIGRGIYMSMNNSNSTYAVMRADSKLTSFTYLSFTLQHAW